MAGLSVPRFTVNDSVPPPRPFGASPLYSPAKANNSWLFCRLSLMSRAAYLPLPSTPCGDRSGLQHLAVPNTPSADFCRPVRTGCPILSPVSRTNGRPPEVSSTAFRTQPPDLQPVSLMDMDFAIISPLVRHRMPQIRFLYIGSYVCSALLSDPASQRRPCASLSLHLHQVVKRTFTFEPSNMLGTPKRARSAWPQALEFILGADFWRNRDITRPGLSCGGL
jgi:hypothetical protein